ncbi:Fc.00g083930.m01.CDS01 [Cosmosporella sp. VM-42]
MLTKITQEYAFEQIPLECDIYTDDKGMRDDIAVLYFHPGGLVDWGRECIAPWLVQVCYQRKWPLISASYRLMPQVTAGGLCQDARAAYKFACTWNVEPGKERRVIVVGASAGYFVASLIPQHGWMSTPLAMFSISGINTFRHPFFNSSTLLVPEPIEKSDMAPFFDGPVVVGTNPVGSASTFVLEKLLPNGTKNPDWYPPIRAPQLEHHKGELYDYYIYKNEWETLVGTIDLGWEWADLEHMQDRRQDWPQTVIFHGNADDDVPLDMSQQLQKKLGDDKVSLFIAEGQPHLFELTNFIEDEGPGMDAVREAVSCLDEIVASKLPSSDSKSQQRDQ